MGLNHLWSGPDISTSNTVQRLSGFLSDTCKARVRASDDNNDDDDDDDDDAAARSTLTSRLSASFPFLGACCLSVLAEICLEGPVFYF